MKKLISLLLALVMVLGTAPFASTAAGVEDRTIIEYAEKADIPTRTEHYDSGNGSDYTTSSSLAAKLNNVFTGSVQLFDNTDATYPLGSYLNNSFSYLFGGGRFSGYQCYAYANAVYYYLFGDVPFHGGTAYLDNSIIVMSNEGEASYSSFQAAGIRVGAYMRTTNDPNGQYVTDPGHSLIVLSYDESSIYFLEGNSGGSGLVCITQMSWSEFNAEALGGMRISHVIQPTQEYYSSIGENGTTNRYSVTYMLNGEVYCVEYYAYGEVIYPPWPDAPYGYYFSGWDLHYHTMPAFNIIVEGYILPNHYTVQLHYVAHTEDDVIELATPDYYECEYGREYTFYAKEIDGWISSISEFTMIVYGNHAIFIIYVPDENVALPGDVDNDGQISANDALLAIRAALGLIFGVGQEGDVNGDGVVDANDALIILRVALGLLFL